MVLYPTDVEKMGRPENPESPKDLRSPTKAMSRAALSRSRIDKTRVAPPPPPAPTVSADVIPGRFTEADWISFVEIEEGEDVVGEIVDSLIQRVLDECFKVYLARQRIPYTISQARDAMIKIAEWRFLVRDEGEPGITTDCICDWKEDEEPVPCVTDSWAQGSVPVIHTGLTPRPEDHQVPLDEPGTNIVQEESTINIVSSEEYFPEEPMPPSPEQEPVPEGLSKDKVLKPKLSDMEKKLKSHFKSQNLLHQPAPPPKHENPRREYRPHRGPLRSAGLKSITKSLEDTEKEMLIQQLSQTLPNKEDDEGLANVKMLPTSFHNILKIQLNRPTINKDVVYNEFGRVTSVPKLDPARLPRHRMKPHVEVVDLHKEAEHHLREVIRNRGPAVALKALRGNITNSGKESRSRKLDLDESINLAQSVNFELISQSSLLKPITASKVFNAMEDGDEVQTSFSKSLDIKPLDIKRPISLKTGVVLDSIKLSPGVVLREPDGPDHSTWRGPYFEKDEWLKEEELRPIGSTVPLPKVTVDQLLKDHVPRIRHIASLPPFTPSLRGQS